jgi:hypothetical protein
MARSKPRKKKEYYEAAKGIVGFMGANLIKKGFDSQFYLDRFKPEFDEYEKWFLICEDSATRTPDALTNLDQAQKKFDETLSIGIEMIKSNPLTTDAERINIGIAIGKGGGRHPSPAPTTAPEFFIKKLKELLPGRLALGYKDFGQKLAGRPAHVAYMEYMYRIADEFFTKIEELTERGTDTASPIIFHRPSSDRGKKLSIAGRWVSNSGEAGDWGPVTGFIIP